MAPADQEVPMRILPVVLAAGIAALAMAGPAAGGLFSHKHATAAPPDGTSPQPQNVDCSKVATMQYASMTVEQCQAMMAMAQSAQRSMNDPSGARPGDERLSCTDIEAEMRTLSGGGVSQQHVEEGGRATQDFKQTVAKQKAEATAVAARESAEVTAAAAADTAVGVATGGLVQGRAAYAAQERAQAENRVIGDRMAKEMAPKQQAVFGAVTDSGGDMTQSMQSNPRFARLVKLGMDKQCRGEGR